MENTATILLIILGSVSGVVILLLLVVGVQLWRLISTMQNIANIVSDEAGHAKNIVRKVRAKINQFLRKK